MPHGMVELAIRDPSGYLLSFGQPLPVRPSPTLQGPVADDFGHEGTESNIKSNTTKPGRAPRPRRLSAGAAWRCRDRAVRSIVDFSVGA
jgi:hypothetical protein